MVISCKICISYTPDIFSITQQKLNNVQIFASQAIFLRNLFSGIAMKPQRTKSSATFRNLHEICYIKLGRNI